VTFGFHKTTHLSKQIALKNSTLVSLLFIPAWLASLSHHISRYLIGGLIFTHEILSHIHSFVAIFNSLSTDVCDPQNHPWVSLGGRLYSTIRLVSHMYISLYILAPLHSSSYSLKKTLHIFRTYYFVQGCLWSSNSSSGLTWRKVVFCHWLGSTSHYILDSLQWLVWDTD